MVQQLFSDLEKLKAEVVRLRGKLDSIAIGNQVILNPNVGNNPIPPASSGALIYGTAAPQWGRREIGSEGDVLQVQSGLPVWNTAPAGVPSGTVSDETTFGISPNAGAASTYSRGDHTHGSPADPDINSSSQLVNEFRNFPKQEGAATTLPYWWQKSASATVTEVSTSSEVSDASEGARALKVVTVADGHYAAQRYTYVDEPRVQSGRTMSMIVAVWSVGGKACRIRAQDSTGSVAVSSDVTAASWTVIRLNGFSPAGTWVEPRFEVDTGTGYFIPLGFMIGSRAVRLKPRGLVYKNSASELSIHDMTGAASAGFARQNIDLTSSSSNLAFILSMGVTGRDANSGNEWNYFVYPAGFAAGATQQSCGRWWKGSAGTNELAGANQFVVMCDDGQVVQEELKHWAGSHTLDVLVLFLNGWWEWE